MMNVPPKTLSIDGSPNKELLTIFLEADILLESIRLCSLASTIKYRKYRRIPFYNTYLNKKRLNADKLHQTQFKLTRYIYQRSDEYKATRGY